VLFKIFKEFYFKYVFQEVIYLNMILDMIVQLTKSMLEV